jgi:hypothetical protein
MLGPVIVLFFTVAIYIPLAGVLLYVWWKHGKDEKGITIARIVFLVGSLLLFLYMLTF